jgi:hypothetical protein
MLPVKYFDCSVRNSSGSSVNARHLPNASQFGTESEKNSSPWRVPSFLDPNSREHAR